ncbi:low-density lipoprotein receptor-related protein 3-like isoform X2 [Acanthaster planci]|nr:low-density lipoprotein receptor-related protein 3-like isoform X2 [Acanthaster planci]
MPGETCGYTVDYGDQFKVVSQQIPHGEEPERTSYPPNVSCTIIFRTQPGKRNFLRLSNFEVETSRFCARDGLYLYDGGREVSENLLSANKHALCGTTLSLPNYFVSTGHEVMIKFVTDGSNNSYRGFMVLITPFTEDEYCSGFTCHLTKRCITMKAMCNSEYQCEDGSDEPPNCHLLNAGFRPSCAYCHWSLLISSWFIIACQRLLAGSRLVPSLCTTRL